MRVSTDDALRRVDARWLGVPGWTFPWRPTRYAAYGVGAPVAVVVIFAATRVFGAGFWTVVYGLTIAIVITTYTMRLVDDERPAGTLVPLVWSELGATRGSRYDSASHQVWSLGSVPIFVTGSGGQLHLLVCASPASWKRLRRGPFRRAAAAPSRP